jgi:hypothetical protein
MIALQLIKVKTNKKILSINKKKINNSYNKCNKFNK